MKYLIDTNLLLWFAEGNEQIPIRIRELLLDEKSIIYVSMATLWEIAIKQSLGKLKIPCPLEVFLDEIRWKYNFLILSIDESHILKQSNLPFYHRDPFDRLIFAQSIVENLEFLYTDSVFDKYREL
ncbi:MAG: type II toxin-antitoxin system VapC family toxin [Spirochaetia bacterium]|nr:type II toxin-antitoxin system VapC family toxin [Spirochaetia bacterium]